VSIVRLPVAVLSGVSSAATQLRRPVARPWDAARDAALARDAGPDTGRDAGPDALAAPPDAGRSPARRAGEVAAVTALSAGLAVLMTWPALRDPSATVPQDLTDPLYFVWQLAWVGHALVTDPLDLWTTNAFSGAPLNLAYTDTMLGYAPISALGRGLEGALVVYNVLFVAVAALAFLGAYLLARVLGARWPGALVAAAAFAYAPWRLAHDRHLNVLSTGGIALAFALLAYGHGWRLRTAERRAAGGPAPAARRPRRPGWVLAGWAVACWQLTLGFAVGLPFAWALVVVLGVAAVTGVARSPDGLRAAYRRSRRLVTADVVGGSAFVATGALLAIPYQRVVSDFPIAMRTEEMLERYSPPLRGLVTAPPESIWAGLQDGWRSSMVAVQEQALLPGFVVLALAAVGLGYSAWSPRHRVLLAAGTLVSVTLCLGTSGPFGGEYTYLPLFRHVPGWEALRTPGRLVLWVTLCLGLLAAGAVTRLAEDVARRRAGRVAGSAGGSAGDGAPARRWPRRLAVPAASLGLLLPAVAVTLDGASHMPYPRVPAAPADLAALPQPLMVLPTSQAGDFLVMTWSTDGWPRLANGGSGFEPPTQARLRREVHGFPDERSVEVLRARGVRTVVLVTSRPAGTSWADAAAPTTLPAGLREVPGVARGAVVYALTPAADLPKMPRHR
jgi:hypothetical protein